MLETAAVYWESTVRIYGVTEKSDLSLITIVFPAARLSHWGGKLQEMADELGDFELVLMQQVGLNVSQFSIVCQERDHYSLRRMVEQAATNESETAVQVQSPVELISFHGPHFHDRYGIAQTVCCALENGKVPFLAAGCSGTSVTVVFPEKMGRAGALALAGSFVVPQAEKSQKHSGRVAGR